MQPDDMGVLEDLVRYRIETAKDDLKSAKILRDADSYKGADNRVYYATFHAINAVHALKRRALGSIQKYVNSGDIITLPILIPPEKIMIQFGTIANV